MAIQMYGIYPWDFFSGFSIVIMKQMQRKYQFGYFSRLWVMSTIIVGKEQVFDVHVTIHRVKVLIIKPTRRTNF